jgi:hypothetical protein
VFCKVVDATDMVGRDLGQLKGFSYVSEDTIDLDRWKDWSLYSSWMINRYVGLRRNLKGCLNCTEVTEPGLSYQKF